MLKQGLFALTLSTAAASAAHAQALQPGEWEIHSVTTSRLFPSGQSSTFKHCVTPEDAANPEGWMARQSEKGPCRITPRSRTDDSMSWDVSCPGANMNGSGEARITAPGRVESEMQMATELQGYRFEMNTRALARRIGPCKS